MRIVNSQLETSYLEEFRGLLLTEWGKVDSFEGNEFGKNPPPPLLALENDNLLGGLSYTWYRLEDFSGMKLWINTVFVKSEFRGKGIAKSLITKAVEVAAQTSENELFVFTEFPHLYIPLGWQMVSRQGKNNSLKYKLTKHDQNT